MTGWQCVWVRTLEEALPLVKSYQEPHISPAPQTQPCGEWHGDLIATAGEGTVTGTGTSARGDSPTLTGE
jgi:hypothetical protein